VPPLPPIEEALSIDFEYTYVPPIAMPPCMRFRESRTLPACRIEEPPEDSKMKG
jgi:hypothetical protein